MAAVAPAADQATDLLQKLSLDPKRKTNDLPEVAKKASSGGGDVSSVPVPSSERSVTPLPQDFMDQGMYYPSPAYYYGAPGFEGVMTEWDDYSRYVNPDGVEVPPHGVYGDMYHQGYGYSPYAPYPSPGSPVPTIGHDGQLYAPQHYQYPGQYYHPPTPPPTLSTPNQPPTCQTDVSTAAATEKPAAAGDLAKASSNGIANGKANGCNGSIVPCADQKNSALSSGQYGRGGLQGGLPSSGVQDIRFGYDGMRSPFPWFNGVTFPDGQQRPSTASYNPSSASHVSKNASGKNQNLHPVPQLMGLHAQRQASGMRPAAPVFVSRMYPTGRLYGQCGSAYRAGLGYGSNGYDSRVNGRCGLVADSRYTPRGRGNGLYGFGGENPDGLTELNKGPRGGRLKSQKGFGGPHVTIAVKGQNLQTNGSVEEANSIPARDQFNLEDFPVKYSDARFFIIKSYSEDDIHKSVKYNMWASTPNGNKKLDVAYQESQGKADGCPVFLFFSVNTSGQFVGVAEMVGAVDFNKTLEYWQQDKWNGCFPVKWHIVKDVPNSILKHIILENNDNKPVTNSRDTQEVKLDQGLQMLKLFKEHVSKTSILDDFLFYETRQKAMQARRSKQQQVQKQVSITKVADAVDEKDKDGTNEKSKLQKPLEVLSILKKEAVKNVNNEKPSEENGVDAVPGDVLEAIKSVTQNSLDVNGAANAC